MIIFQFSYKALQIAHRATWARYFCRDNSPLWKHLSDILDFENENESGFARQEQMVGVILSIGTYEPFTERTFSREVPPETENETSSYKQNMKVLVGKKAFMY